MSSELDPERDAIYRDERGPAKLIKFRHMVGIDTPPTLHNKVSKRAARNLGVYTRVVSEERKATYQYYIMSLIINVSFLGQIIIAAALTALSAAEAPRVIITILGSANTVIAGIQTYLKGQGLPNRIKQYQFGLRKLREYIEDRERDFSHENCKLNVDDTIAEVTSMYQAVRQTAEDNTPETYLPMEGAGKKLLQMGGKKNRSTKLPGQSTATDYDGETAVSGSKNDGSSELRNSGAGDGEAADEEAGLSGNNQKGRNKPTDDEDGEATPLLK
ncbi:MAG: hypothetical protein M1812_008280 [Candelaria pacifica]|nr:MAG: hypothetical protein M1812_008280 [Candelaria pacifica]